MKKIIVLVLSLALLSCSEVKQGDFKPERQRQEFSTKVVLFESQEALIRHCKSLGVWQSESVEKLIRTSRGIALGCNAFEHESQTCTVYTLTPKSIDDPITLMWGHEFVHCVFGQYH